MGLVTKLDGTERRAGTKDGDSTMLPVWTVERHGKYSRVDSYSVLQRWAVETYGKVVPSKKEKGSEEWKKARENTR